MNDKRRATWLVVTACWLAVAAAARGDDERLVEAARQGNRAALAAVARMECRFERRPAHNTTPQQAHEQFHMWSGQYWRSGDQYRLLLNSTVGGLSTHDRLVRDGQGLLLNTHWQQGRRSLIRDFRREHGELWEYLLFSHWGSDTVSFYPFDEVLRRRHVIRGAHRLPGGDIYVALEHANGQLEFWFDPEVGYLVRKSVMVPAGDSRVRWEHQVEAFAEPAPGVFVPLTVGHRCFVEGELRATVRTILSDLKLNDPATEASLRLPKIEGLECWDCTRDTKYVVDADGQPAGPETPLEIYRGPLTPMPAAPAGMGDATRAARWDMPPEETRPPAPVAPWGVTAVAFLLVAGAVLAVVWRRETGASR